LIYALIIYQEVKIEKLAELVSISINKNSVPGDKSALSPGGIRLGSASLTSRGFVEEDFKKVGEFLHQVIELALKIQDNSGKSLKDFEKCCNSDMYKDEIDMLRCKVNLFASQFELYD
jgi:glycine hydroxymethyltransferase